MIKGFINRLLGKGPVQVIKLDPEGKYVIVIEGPVSPNNIQGFRQELHQFYDTGILVWNFGARAKVKFKKISRKE